MARQHRLYKSVWYWSEEDNKLSVIGAVDKEKTKQVGAQPGSTKSLDNSQQKTVAFYFADTIDQNQQMIFRQKYQRGVKPHAPNVVTIQDIKDVVMYLANGYIPAAFVELFCSNEINLFLRSVILYMQLYLKVWEDLEYRSNSYKNQRLKHPIAIKRETLCKSNLSKLRSRIGQEYALFISGQNKYKKYHHMNNTLNRSYTGQDMMLYDYLIKFITRTVWIALNRINYKEIETEVNRLFSFKEINRGTAQIKSSTSKTKSGHEADGKILHGDELQLFSKWHKRSPVISDIFVNKEIPGSLQEDEISGEYVQGQIVKGIEAALKLPEELLVGFGITVGILGLPRDSFEPLLTIRQRQKSIEEEEMERLITNGIEEIKPKIKMYEYLYELENMIDTTNNVENKPTKDSADIIQEILSYEKI